MKRQRVKFPWDLYWENKTYKPDAYKLVITKGYGVRATTIEGQNAFAPDGQNTGDQITSDKRSKRA